MPEDYCVRVSRLTEYSVLDEYIVEGGDLDSIEEQETLGGKRCVVARVESRHVLVCSDGEEFTIAYRVKC